ncbi:MAG: helix-turn-helix transcriptional regulator [Candidatus Omnitrophota bacterium]|nr:helix-turn-helix transcriptional regulator [Candidatus Omnitrophota bacterium]
MKKKAIYYEDERNKRPVEESIEVILMKRKIIVPKTINQHIEEELRKSPGFRKAYDEEVARLQIGYKITQLRQMRHLSQAELAKKVNTTQQTISRLEDLRNARINLKTLARLAAALRARLSIDFIPRELSV